MVENDLESLINVFIRPPRHSMPPKIRRNRLFFILTNISKKPNLVTLLKSCKLYAIPIIIIGGAKLFESVYKILPPHVADVVFFRDSHVGTFVNMDFYVYAPNAAPPGSALEGGNHNPYYIMCTLPCCLRATKCLTVYAIAPCAPQIMHQ